MSLSFSRKVAKHFHEHLIFKRFAIWNIAMGFEIQNFHEGENVDYAIPDYGTKQSCRW
jgi:hypothetical protein